MNVSKKMAMHRAMANTLPAVMAPAPVALPKPTPVVAVVLPLMTAAIPAIIPTNLAVPLYPVNQTAHVEAVAAAMAAEVHVLAAPPAILHPHQAVVVEVATPVQMVEEEVVAEAAAPTNPTKPATPFVKVATVLLFQEVVTWVLPATTSL